MKKWTILAIAVLGAVLLAMQYMMERKKGALSGVPAQQTAGEQVGVALPAGATTYESPKVMDNYVPEAGGGAVYGSNIYLPTIQSAYKGACQGGSLTEMLGTHDKYWGFFAMNTSFSPEESKKMYGLLSDYVSCQAAARTDVSLCDSLPGAAEKDGKKVDAKASPNYSCRRKTVGLLFEAYLAGNIKGDSYCRLGLSDWDKEDLAKFSVPEFCDALSKGPENAAPFLLKAFAPAPPEAAERIAMDFPVREGDCKKDADCLIKYKLYSAVKGGRPQDCPKESQPQCRALSERSTVPCEKLLQDMSQFYCSAVTRVKKSTGGYIGMSKEDIKADIDKVKAQKAQEESMKKEQQKLTDEVNKRVRETLNKN